MKVILELNIEDLDKFQSMAEQEHRSRKNFMESVLINFLTGNPPTLERQTKVSVKNLTEGQPTSNYTIDTTKEERIKELEEKIKLVPSGQYYNKVVKGLRDEINMLKSSLKI